MAGQITDTIIDITRRFELEVSRERIEECEVNKMICSPEFTVKTDNEVSKWIIVIWPNYHNNALIAISLRPGDVSLKVEVEKIGVKTETGNMPGKPVKDWRSKMVSKIKHFNGKSEPNDRTCYINAGSSEDFLKLIKNKVTVEAILRFYVDRNEYIEKSEREQVFLTHIRSICDLDPLADFTGEKAIDLIDLADRYDLQDLIQICENSLVNNLTAESVIETLISMDLHIPNSQHRQKILDFMKAKAAQVVKSCHWKEFLVKYPDLVAEIFVWAALPPGEDTDN